MPNFFVPMVQQGQQGQRPGGRRGGPGQQNQQPVPMMQQQVGPPFPTLLILYDILLAIMLILCDILFCLDGTKGEDVQVSSGP